MFQIFKKRKGKGSNKKKKFPILTDLDGNQLHVGDKVISMRYDLEECIILESDNGLVYESVGSREKVSWVKMIDASTDCQKVKKIPEN